MRTRAKLSTMRKTVVVTSILCAARGFNNDIGTKLSTSIEIRKPLASTADDVI